MEMNIRDFFMLMFRRILFLILGAVIGFGTFFAITKVTEVPQYVCEITMVVNADSETSATLGTINASRALTESYIAIMKDKAFAQQIKAELPASTDYSVSKISSSLSAYSKDDSQILAVTVKTASAQDSYNIAKVIQRIAPNTLRTYLDNTGSIQPLLSAQKPTSAQPSNIAINSFLGAILGFVMAVLIVFLVEKLDKRIRTEEDILSVVKCPILGAISRVE